MQVVPGYSDFTFVLHDRVLGLVTVESKRSGTFWVAENYSKRLKMLNELSVFQSLGRSEKNSGEPSHMSACILYL